MQKKLLISFFIVSVALSIGINFEKYIVSQNFNVYLSEDSSNPSKYNQIKEMIVSDALECEWASSPYIFFSDNVFSQLIYYSHLLPIFSLLFVLLIVVKKTGLSISTTPLLVLSTLFIAWSLGDLYLWANEDPEKIMFVWSILMLLEVLMFYSTAWLVYAFVNNKQPPLKAFFIAFVILLPVLTLLPTSLNLVAFDYTNCDREAIEGVLWNYVYLIEAFIILIILFINTRRTRSLTDTHDDTKKNYLFSTGTIIFLLLFMMGNIAGTFTEDWAIAQYGILGMPIFLCLLGYLIVKFRIFNLNVFASEALVILVWFLVGSLILVARSPQTRLVAALTLIMISFVGYMLVKSVKKEIAQREEIARLAQNLQFANERLKILDRMKSEFVSIASHQLRSPLTSIRGYASMLAEGTYGKLPPKAEEVVHNIVDSSRFMAISIEDYLNVSRIEAGNMKYEMSDFSVKEAAERVVDELRQVAMKRGLVLVFRSDCTGSCTIHADVGKFRQVLLNLIDNSIKYTPKGSVTVVVHDDPKTKKIIVTIQDTGVGMNKETVEALFDKFVRAKNANNVNVTGTGLGLYVAKKMVIAMGGTIRAESEGEGKGSTFHIEFQAVRPT